MTSYFVTHLKLLYFASAPFSCDTSKLLVTNPTFLRVLIKKVGSNTHKCSLRLVMGLMMMQFNLAGETSNYLRTWNTNVALYVI